MKICTNCGYEGNPIRQKAGAFAALALALVVIIEWSLVISLFWITIPIALVATAYFTYRFFTSECPKCKNVSMVYKGSLAGKEYLKHPHTPTSNVVYSKRDPEAEIYIKE